MSKTKANLFKNILNIFFIKLKIYLFEGVTLYPCQNLFDFSLIYNQLDFNNN